MGKILSEFQIFDALSFVSPNFRLFSINEPSENQMKFRRLTCQIAIRPLFDFNLKKIKCYFFFISFPQHINGTLQASSDPEVQEQGWETFNSSPQASQKNISPSFISQQLAMCLPPQQVNGFI